MDSPLCIWQRRVEHRASQCPVSLSLLVCCTRCSDRLLHHCHIVNIRGNSYRMREHQDWLRAETEKRRKRVAG